MKVFKIITYIFFILLFTISLVYDFYISIRERALLAMDIEVVLPEKSSEIQVFGITRNNDQIEFENKGISFISKDKYFKSIEIKNYNQLDRLMIKIGNQINPSHLVEISSKDPNTVIVQGKSESLLSIFRGFANYSGDLALFLQIVFLVAKFLFFIILLMIINFLLTITYKILPTF